MNRCALRSAARSRAAPSLVRSSRSNPCWPRPTASRSPPPRSGCWSATANPPRSPQPKRPPIARRRASSPKAVPREDRRAVDSGARARMVPAAGQVAARAAAAPAATALAATPGGRDDARGGSSTGWPAQPRQAGRRPAGPRARTRLRSSRHETPTTESAVGASADRPCVPSGVAGPARTIERLTARHPENRCRPVRPANVRSAAPAPVTRAARECHHSANTLCPT